MKRYLRSCLALAAVLLLASPAAAEVSVLLDNTGTQILGYYRYMEPANGLIWEKVSNLPDSQVLNRWGDDLGDRMPACGLVAMPGAPDDLIATPPLPLVVWPRQFGDDYDLVWSGFGLASDWPEAAFVEQVDNDVDDLDPRLLVATRRAAALWWREDPTPTAWFSIWKAGAFDPPEPLVDNGLGGAHPFPFVAPSNRYWAGVFEIGDKTRLRWREMGARLAELSSDVDADLPPAEGLVAMPGAPDLDLIPVMAVWPQDSDGQYDLRFAIWNDLSQKWSSTLAVHPDPDHDDVSPTLLLEKDLVWLAWVRYEGETPNVYLSRWDGETWTIPERVGQGENPVFDTPSSDGRVYLGISPEGAPGNSRRRVVFDHNGRPHYPNSQQPEQPDDSVELMPAE